MIYLLDTDIINYILRDTSPYLDRYQRELGAGARFILSPFVHYEITRYFRLRGMHRLQNGYHQLIQSWVQVEIIDSDWDIAADLWANRHRQGSPIEDSDLLIAFTALKSEATLVTNNKRHFGGFDLAIIDWSIP